MSIHSGRLLVHMIHLNSSAVTPPLKFELNHMSIFFTSCSSTMPFTLLTMATHSSKVIPPLASWLAVTGPSTEDPQPILFPFADSLFNCCWCHCSFCCYCCCSYFTLASVAVAVAVANNDNSGLLPYYQNLLPLLLPLFSIALFWWLFDEQQWNEPLYTFPGGSILPLQCVTSSPWYLAG